MIESMLRKAEAGGPVYVPDGTGGAVVSQRASQSDLMQALSAVKGGGAAGSASSAVSPGAFPVRGEACYSNRAWCDLKLAIAADLCTDTCTVKDEISARLTVNPGANKVSKVSYSSLYSPNGGDFNEVHFQWYTLIWAEEHQCGSGNTDPYSGNGSGVFYPTCSGTSYHSRLTHAFHLWGHLIPNGQWTSDSAKTGTSECASKPDTYCIY